MIETITLIGLSAATLTTISFIPQVIKVWKTKKTKDISLRMYIIFCTGMALWLIYGIMLKEIPIILANSITIILASIILFFKIRHK